MKATFFHIQCKLLPNKPVSLLLRFHRALTARLATHSNVESPIKRLRIPNSTRRDPAPAVQVSFMLSRGTPNLKLTCMKHKTHMSLNLLDMYSYTDHYLSHPGVRNARAGVLKGWQQADSQVMSQVQQLIIIIFKPNITKGMLRVSQQNVCRDKASQDPSKIHRNNTEAFLHEQRKQVLKCDLKKNT